MSTNSNGKQDSDAAPDHSPRPLTVAAVGLTLLTAALWGGTAVAVRFSVESIPPFMVAACRFLLGAAFMLFWCRFEGSSLKLTPKQVVPSFITGTLLFLQIGTFNLGLSLSNASHGTLLINTFVFWVVAIEHLVTGGDRASPRRILGLVVAAVSVALILPASHQPSAGENGVRDAPNLVGDGLLLLSAFLLAIKIVYTKHALRVVEPGKLIFWHDVVGVVWFLLCSWLFETVSWDRVDLPAVLGLLYQGVVVAGLCFALQATLLKRHSASQISVFSFSTPLFGVTLAVLMRGDRLSPWLLLAAVGVAAGIWLVTVRGKVR